MPDEKSIVQFLITMAHETPGKCGPNETLSLHTMETALDIIREYCIFTYSARFIQKRGFSKRIGMPLALCYIISSFPCFERSRPSYGGT